MAAWGYRRLMNEAGAVPDPEGGPGDGDDPSHDVVEVALATPAQRLGGAVVDGALLQVAGLALVGLDRPVAAALSTAGYLVYEVVMVVLRGQTLGKMALGTRVVGDPSGRLPSLWQAATRAVVPMAGVLVEVGIGLTAVGAFWVLAVYGSLLLDDRRRGLHDKAAGTMVTALERSAGHRRAGAAAVIAAVAVTAMLVAAAVDELEDAQPAAQERAEPTRGSP